MKKDKGFACIAVPCELCDTAVNLDHRQQAIVRDNLLQGFFKSRLLGPKAVTQWTQRTARIAKKLDYTLDSLVQRMRSIGKVRNLANKYAQ